MFFRDVVGHKELKEKFTNDVRENTISHAHLLLGETGYGTLSLALAFTQYILCENKLEDDSCGTCSSCRMVQKLEHPDVHFSFPTVQTETNTSDSQFPIWKNMVLENPYADLNEWINRSDDKGRKPIISVHQSLDIIRKLTLKSFVGGHKVSIIWMAEEMNTASANKLLKIIEEPPANTVFILIAASEDTILPTILSRTQITKVKKLSSTELKSYLSQTENTNEDLIESIVSRSHGNIFQAIELLSQGEEENSHFYRFVDLMRNCYKKDVNSMLDWAEDISTLGREPQKNFLKYCLYMMRQSIVKNYTESKLMSTSSEEAKFLQNFAQFITGNNIMDFNRLFNEAHYGIERNGNSKLLFTNITFEVMRYINRA